MGSNDGESDEKPIHTVTVSDFYIGKYEVTQKEWKAIMGSNPSNFKGDDLPVEKVSWNDIQDYLQKLNAKTGQHYRLPTEAEWEYAARGGNKSNNYEYSGSNNIDNVAWYDRNSGYQTHRVGTKQANELGIYDMSGNVMEWCDPSEPSADGEYPLRGGAFLTGPADSEVEFSQRFPGDDRYDLAGFRVVLDQGEPDR